MNTTDSPTPAEAPSQELTVPDLTFGEKAVGLKFNPEAHTAVDVIKRHYADAVDCLHNIRISLPKDKSEEKAMLTLAIRDLQTSQMWAVKAVTWKY